MRNVLIVLLSFLLAPLTAGAQDFWEPANGPSLGDVTALAVSQSGYTFAGTQSGGIFRSTDNGNTWNTVNKGLTNLNVTSLIANGTTVYAGTQGGGVFRSTNNGDSWQSINTRLSNLNVTCLAISPSGVFHAGTNGGGVFRYIFRLITFGFIWEPVNNGLMNLNVNCLVSNTINGSIYAGTNGGGVFRRSSNNNNWTPINISQTNLNVTSLAISPNGVVFAGTNGDGVFRLYPLPKPPFFFWTAVKNGLSNLNVTCLDFHPNGTLYAGTAGRGVFYSFNNGGYWRQSSFHWRSRPIIHSLVINKSDESLSLAGTENGGVLRGYRTPNGLFWDLIGIGLANLEVYPIAVNQSGVVFAGATAWYETGASGIFRSFDNGKSWEQVNIGLTSRDVSSFAFDHFGYVFAGTNKHGIFRANYQDGIWNPVNNGLTDLFIRFVGTNSKEYIFAGASGIFRSKDHANSWERRSDFSPNDFSTNFFATNSKGYVFASSDVVLRSKDDGDNWEIVGNWNDPTKLYPHVTSLAIGSNDFIFAAVWDIRDESGHDIRIGVFRSKDDGESWEKIDDGSRDIIYLIVNSNGHIYAGNHSGIFFRSTDNGDSWTPISGGLTGNGHINSFVIGQNGYVFAGATGLSGRPGNGVYRSTQPITAVR